MKFIPDHLGAGHQTPRLRDRKASLKTSSLPLKQQNSYKRTTVTLLEALFQHVSTVVNPEISRRKTTDLQAVAAPRRSRTSFGPRRRSLTWAPTSRFGRRKRGGWVSGFLDGILKVVRYLEIHEQSEGYEILFVFLGGMAFKDNSLGPSILGLWAVLFCFFVGFWLRPSLSGQGPSKDV